MKNKLDESDLITAIDSILPQTQCQLCSYPGCLPYAEAIVKNGEQINRCLPGGVDTLNKLGELLQQDVTSLLADMAQKAKPNQIAVIREEECIGCTKCIQACPVDAIIGASKQMHTIIADFCTGCELCLEPCPVDCIDILPIPEPHESDQQKISQLSRQRFQQHQARLANQPPESDILNLTTSYEDRMLEIEAAMQRIKDKKEKDIRIKG